MSDLARPLGATGLSVTRVGLGLAARDLSRPAVTIGSKWSYTHTADRRPDATVHEVKNLSVFNLERQVTESRTLLGDRLALYQIHVLPDLSRKLG